MSRCIIVINPYIVDFKLYDEWMHPLGLYFLISLLLENGFNVRYFNCLDRTGSDKTKKYNTGDFSSVEIEKPRLYRSIPRKYKRYGRPEKELRDFLQSAQNPALICIGSAMTYWLPGAAETARIARSVHPAVPLVIGGSAARLMPDAVKSMFPRIAVAGPIRDQEPFRLHPSLPPLKTAGPRTLLGALKLLDKPLHGPALLTLGCPMACTYCASQLLQGAFRIRSIEPAVEEIAYLNREKGVSDFAFYDDALLFQSLDGILPFLKSLSAKSISARFHAPNGLHLRFLSTPLLLAMREAGFVTLRFGYETGSVEYRRDTSTKAGRSELAEKIGLVKQCGFDCRNVGVYAMAGLSGQKPADVLEEIEFIASLGVQAKPVYLSPVPGTRLFDFYAAKFPQIRTDPLWHNDLFFITNLDGWNWEEMEKIRDKTRKLNNV